MRRSCTRASRPRSFLLTPRVSRVVVLLTVAILAWSITLAASGASSAPSFARIAASTSDPIVGDWNVTYGAPAVVTISLSGGVYTETAKTPVRVTGSSCDLPSGTIIATFSLVGGNAYSGQHGLWYQSSCAFAYSTSLSLTLSSDGHTLTGSLGIGGGLVFSKILMNQSIAFAPLANKTYGAPNFTVSATASSGLTVSFAASGNCTVSGTTVHITRAGSCTITASQVGNSNFGPAPTVSRTFSIAQSSKCVVPNVVGMLLSKAVPRITKAHCRPGWIIRRRSSKAFKNRVLAQNLKPGTKLKHAAEVNLTVGKGPRR